MDNNNEIDFIMATLLSLWEERNDNKINFFTRQYLEAISPANFFYMNPEVYAECIKTNGESMTAGMKQYLEDIKDGRLNMKITDVHGFEIGKNIACTPGDIVLQNDLMQLIQYRAATEKVYQIPLLIVPPWINKYYILDLQPENSFVKWLVDQGFTVYMISWVNPTHKHKNKTFTNYMLDGPMAALNMIKQTTNTEKVNLLGYCIGGTLLACLLSYLAKKKETSIVSATFLTTLLDFREPGDLGHFVNEKQIEAIEKNMKEKGYLDGRLMSTVFSVLRAKDLIWSPYVNNYLKGKKPKAFDLLYWNSDATNIPEKVHRFYLRNMYLNNFLVKKNKIKLNKVSMDLGKIKVPSYFIAAKDDHIVPWKSCFQGSQYLGETTRFVLVESGHVAGMINPPHKNKYGYAVYDDKFTTPEQFEKNGEMKTGSWWVDWLTWLMPYSGDLIEKKTLKQAHTLEKAPGSYVKVKISS